LELFFYFFIFIFGLCIGSFLNVVIYRLPKKESIVSPGSHCPRCQTPLNWFHNIPVISYFVILRGHCKFCDEKISFRYPFVEIITGILFLLISLVFGIGVELFWYYFPIVSILICIFWIDIDHRIIPDQLNFLLLFFGLLGAFFSVKVTLINAAVGGGFGFVLFYFFSWAYFKVTGQMGLGGGDIKYLGAIGTILGFVGVLDLIFLSSILGSVIGILYLKFSGQKAQMKSSIAFGPFLVFATLYLLIGGDFLWRPFMTLM
tara:strand:+ start:2249 stop:3028 length:780 start_codon:yes stop_codon:yes gene_type:complete